MVADSYFHKQTQWAPILNPLRDMMHSLGLDEGVKWGTPVYMVEGKNVVSLAGFKSFVSIWFHQGALLDDPQGWLQNAQPGKTKAMRQIRFTALEQVDTETLRGYIQQAKEHAEAGLKVVVDPNRPVEVPVELQEALDGDATLNAAFQGLSKACQREYADHIGEAIRPETRDRRLARCRPLILAGVARNAAYH